MDEGDDILRGRAGQEDLRDAGLFHGRNVCFGNDAADENRDVVHTLFAQQGHELRADGVVCAGKDREADNVDVFLDGGGGDHLGGLAEAGVDHLHARIAQGTGDDFGAAVVAIQPWFGDQHSYFFLRDIRRRVSSVPTRKSCDGDFFVGAEDLAEGVADFSYGGVGFHCVEEEGH